MNKQRSKQRSTCGQSKSGSGLTALWIMAISEMYAQKRVLLTLTLLSSSSPFALI